MEGLTGFTVYNIVYDHNIKFTRDKHRQQQTIHEQQPRAGDCGLVSPYTAAGYHQLQ